MSGAVFLCSVGRTPLVPAGRPRPAALCSASPERSPNCTSCLELPRVSSLVRKLIALLCLACAAVAQAPRIGDINYYGLRKVTAEKIQAATGLRSEEHTSELQS